MRLYPDTRFSFRRIGAMVLRYLYLFRSSWARIIEQLYWPTMQMIMWGFVTKFFVTNSAWVAQASGVLLSAVLLWDVLYRAQLGVSAVFLEELFARNVGHLFASPLRPQELAAALIVISFLRTVFAVGVACLLAIPLYHYNIFAMGLPMLAFFTLLLVFGWALGFVMCAVLLRWGLGAQGLIWGAVFALAPISGIYYPIATLPSWLHPLAWSIPSSYVFEGMRTVLYQCYFDWALFQSAVLLTLFYLCLGIIIFLWSIHIARVRGLLLQASE